MLVLTVIWFVVTVILVVTNVAYRATIATQEKTIRILRENVTPRKK